jgi:hypothetical protein
MDKYINMHMFASIISYVGLIIGFIGIFFFGYASIIEQEIVKSNISIVTTDLLNIVSPLIDNKTKSDISLNLTYPDMSVEDDETEVKNKELINSAVIFLSSLFICFTLIAIGLSYYYKFSFINMTILNLVILVFVGLTEFSFLHLLPSPYISADPNFVKYTILLKLREKFKLEDNTLYSPASLDDLKRLLNNGIQLGVQEGERGLDQPIEVTEGDGLTEIQIESEKQLNARK